MRQRREQRGQELVEPGAVTLGHAFMAVSMIPARGAHQGAARGDLAHTRWMIHRRLRAREARLFGMDRTARSSKLESFNEVPGRDENVAMKSRWL